MSGGGRSKTTGGRETRSTPGSQATCPDEATFELALISALQNADVGKAIAEAIRPHFQSMTDQITKLAADNANLASSLVAKDQEISLLKGKQEVLEGRLDALEQWGRRGSMRIQGLPDLPGEKEGDVDSMILSIVNENLSQPLDPPLELNDIEVAHRLPHPREKLKKFQRENNIKDGTPLDSMTADQKVKFDEEIGPRAVIVKFASRRVKTRVMRARKQLKSLPKEAFKHPIYFQDDLTATRSKLAFEARRLKQANVIGDTWVWDSKILIKDKHGRIYPINSQKDINRLSFQMQPPAAGADSG